VASLKMLRDGSQVPRPDAPRKAYAQVAKLRPVPVPAGVR
jgi:hypothetical protein